MHPLRSRKKGKKKRGSQGQRHWDKTRKGNVSGKRTSVAIYEPTKKLLDLCKKCIDLDNLVYFSPSEKVPHLAKTGSDKAVRLVLKSHLKRWYLQSIYLSKEHQKEQKKLQKVFDGLCKK